MINLSFTESMFDILFTVNLVWVHYSYNRIVQIVVRLKFSKISTFADGVTDYIRVSRACAPRSVAARSVFQRHFAVIIAGK